MEENKIYSFLKENGLTDKSESEFLTEYSDSTKAQELHKFFSENKLTDKDFGSFYDEYLKKKDELGAEVSESVEEPTTSGASEANKGLVSTPTNEILAEQPKTEEEKQFKADPYFDEKVNVGDSRYGVSLYNYSKSNIEKGNAVSKYNGVIENINSGKDPNYNAIVEKKKKEIQDKVDKLSKEFDLKQPKTEEEVDEYNKKVADFNKKAKQIQDEVFSTIDKDVDSYVKGIVPEVTEDKYLDKDDKAQVDLMLKDAPKTYEEKKAYVDKIVESMTYFYDEKEKKEAKSELYNYLSEKMLFDAEGNPTQYALKNQAETRLEKVNSRVAEIESQLAKFTRTQQERNRGAFAGTQSFTMSSEERKLTEELANLRQAQNKYQEVIELPDAEKGVKVGKFSDAFTGEAVADILTGGFASAFVAMDVLSKISKGEKATDAEKEMLNALSLNNAAKGDIQENLKLWAKTGQTIAGSLPFISSIMMSGGASAMAKAGTKKALGWQLQKGIKNRLISQVGNVASAATRVPFYGGLYKDLAERRKEVGMKYDPITGQYAADVKESEKPFIADAAKQFLTTFTEFYAEELGGTIAARIVNPVAKRIGIKGLNNSIFKKVTEATKLNDPITEYLEEVVTGVMQVGIGEQDPKEFFTLKNQWETLFATTVMSGVPQVVTAPFSKNKEGLAEHFNKKQISEIEKILSVEDISEKAKQLTQFSYDNKISDEAVRSLGDYAWKSQAEQVKDIAKEEAETTPERGGAKTAEKTATETAATVSEESKDGAAKKIAPERVQKADFVKARGVELAEDISDNELDKVYREERVKKIKEDNVELDNSIAEAQKRLSLPTTPDIEITDDTELTLEQIDNEEQVPNVFVKSASKELYDRYNELEAMKQSDSRAYTTEQIESMQEYLGEEITKLEEYAARQTETGEFIGKAKVSETAETGATEVVEEKVVEKERVTIKKVEDESNGDGRNATEAVQERTELLGEKPEVETEQKGSEKGKGDKKTAEKEVEAEVSKFNKQNPPPTNYEDSEWEKDCVVVSSKFVGQVKNKQDYELIGGKTTGNETVDFHVAVLHKPTGRVIDLTYGQFDEMQPTKTYTKEEFEQRFDTKGFKLSDYLSGNNLKDIEAELAKSGVNFKGDTADAEAEVVQPIKSGYESNIEALINPKTGLAAVTKKIIKEAIPYRDAYMKRTGVTIEEYRKLSDVEKQKIDEDWRNSKEYAELESLGTKKIKEAPPKPPVAPVEPRSTTKGVEVPTEKKVGEKAVKQPTGADKLIEEIKSISDAKLALKERQLKVYQLGLKEDYLKKLGLSLDLVYDSSFTELWNSGLATDGVFGLNKKQFKEALKNPKPYIDVVKSFNLPNGKVISDKYSGFGAYLESADFKKLRSEFDKKINEVGGVSPTIKPKNISDVEKAKLNEKADTLISDGLSELAELLGVKKSLTGEDRAKLIPAIKKIAEGLAIKLGLKGKELLDAVLKTLRDSNIELEEEFVSNVLNEKEDAKTQQGGQVRVQSTETGEGQGQRDSDMPKIDRTVVQDGKEAEEERIAENEKKYKDETVVKETVEEGGKRKVSRYGIRYAFSEKMTEKGKELYREGRLFEYTPEKQEEVVEIARSIVDLNNLDKSIELMRNKELPSSIRVAIGGFVLKEITRLAEQAYESGNTELGDVYAEKESVIQEEMQTKLATEWGRGISMFGSEFISEMLSPYKTARQVFRAYEKRRRNTEKSKGYKRTKEAVEIELYDLRKKVLEALKKNPKVQEAKRKYVTKEVDPELKKIRDKRQSLIERLKTTKTTSVSAIGLSNEQIEIGTEIAITYIQEGIYDIKKLISKLKAEFKKAEIKLTDEQALALLPEELGNKPVKDVLKEQSVKKALDSYGKDKDFKKAVKSVINFHKPFGKITYEQAKGMLPKEIDGKDIDDIEREEALAIAAERLASQEFGHVIDKKAPKSDPLNQMVKTLLAKFKERAEQGEKAAPKKNIDIVKEAILNKKEYMDVWNEAKDIAIQYVKDNEDLGESVKDKYIARINEAYTNATTFSLSEKRAQQLIREYFTEKEVSLENVVKDFYETRELHENELVRKLVDELGLEEADAKELGAVIHNAFQTLMTEKGKSVLDRYVKNKTKEKKKNIVKDHVAQLIELINIGAFDSQEATNIFNEMYGLETLTKEQSDEIVKMGKLVQETKSPNKRHKQTQRLMSYIESLKGVDPAEVSVGVWYANVLFGMTTHLKNYLDAYINSWTETIRMAGYNPMVLKRAVAAHVRGFWKEGGLRFTEAMATGYSPIANKFDIVGVLERYELKAKDGDALAKILVPILNTYKNILRGNLRLLPAFDALNYSSTQEAMIDIIESLDVLQSYSGMKMTKEIRKKVKDEIDRKLALLPDIRARIETQVEQESEDYKKTQAKYGQEPIGYTEREKRIRVYELINQERSVNTIEKAQQLSGRTIGNIAAYSEMGKLITQLSNFLRNLEVNAKMPVFTPKNILKKGLPVLSSNSTKEIKIRPFSLLMAFTRIVSNVAVRNMGGNLLVALGRAKTGRYGQFLAEGDPYRVEMTKEEKAKARRFVFELAATLTILWMLTEPGEDDEDPALQITLKGTGDYKRNKKELEPTGWRESSIIFKNPFNPNKDIHVDYRLFGQSAIPFMTIGYIRDKQRYQGRSKDSELKLFAEALAVTIPMVIETTPIYMVSKFSEVIFSIAKGEEKGFNKLAEIGGSMGGGFLAPRVAKDIEEIWDVINEEPHKTATGTMDKLTQYLPFYGKLVPYGVENYDVLGNRINKTMRAAYIIGNARENKDIQYYLKQGYSRPINDVRVSTFTMYDAAGNIVRRKLDTGNKKEVQLWNNYDEQTGKLFHERLVYNKSLGLTGSEFTDQMEKDWSEVVDQVKKDVFNATFYDPVPYDKEAEIIK